MSDQERTNAMRARATLKERISRDEVVIGFGIKKKTLAGLRPSISTKKTSKWTN